MNKRYKSTGSSSFNTKDSGEGSINLNTTVRTEDENEMEEVHEVRRPKSMGRDQAKRKMKGGSASSASSFNMRELAKMMASEYVMEEEEEWGLGLLYNLTTVLKPSSSSSLKIVMDNKVLKPSSLYLRLVDEYSGKETIQWNWTQNLNIAYSMVNPIFWRRTANNSHVR
nr:hypothetical protein [Tanacetum cinerariifolium]